MRLRQVVAHDDNNFSRMSVMGWEAGWQLLGVQVEIAAVAISMYLIAHAASLWW